MTLYMLPPSLDNECPFLKGGLTGATDIDTAIHRNSMYQLQPYMQRHKPVKLDVY